MVTSNIMQKIYLLIASILFMSLNIDAQTYTITGKTQDTMNVKPIVFASVSLIRQSDSILITITRTNQQGVFNLKTNKADKYIILIAHGTFVDYVDNIELKEGDKTKDLGNINMYQRGQLLKEVIIKNSAAIKIKGDTLEYLADSFKVKQGAVVEDLLKVLPGIQVNKQGEITAMGEKVEKVLVDGEEFFGDDPTVATQNLQSKVVEKVQVFDKKSEQATFTGFDDGETQKTINLKLKDNMNHGVFGKLALAGGWEDRWENQGMINAFKNKRQMSAYGLMSSNGRTGLGWQDKNTYTGSGGGMQMDEDGGFMWTFSDDEDDNTGRGGMSSPEGITKAWTGGLHYANKWNENQHHLNVNYSYGLINRTKKEHSFTQNLLPNSSYFTNDTSNSFSSRNIHKITARHNWNIDSATTLIYNLNTRLSFNESETYNATNNITPTEVPINTSQRDNNSKSTTTRVSNQITVNRKFKKTGRTISLNTSYVFNNNDADGMLDGNNSYQQSSSTIYENLDQKKVQGLVQNTLTAELTYTEPLSKKFLLKTSYGYSSDQSQSQKSTLVKPTLADDYSKRIDSLSSDFNSNVFSHTVGTELKYNEKKYNLAAGARVRYSIFHQDDLVRKLNYDYNRINVFPVLRFNYKFDQFSRFSFTYNGSTQQPSITQIQPVQDNSNPLNIYIGNPNLKMGYNQSFNVTFFNYKVLSSRSIYSGINFSNNFNNISINRVFDQLGRIINQYININGGYNASLWGGINTKIPKTIFDGRLNVSGNLNHTPNIINNVKGITNTYSITFTPGISYTQNENMNLSLDLGTMYNNSQSSVRSNGGIKYFSFTPSASASYIFKEVIELGTDADYQFNPAVSPYKTNFNRLIWNSYVSYKMLKKKNLQWKLSVNDMLNQNRGYERTTTNNYNTERFFQTLGRYWMVGLVWNFSSGPMAEAQANQGGGMGRPKMGGGRGGGRRMGR